MRRKLSGSLADLRPTTLVRLLAATQPSGTLDLDGGPDVGKFSLDIVRGRVARPQAEDLRRLRDVLSATSGTFRFEPAEAGTAPADGVSLGEILELVREAEERRSFASDLDVDALLAGGGAQAGEGEPPIHLLGGEAPEHPLDDLLKELESTAPDELLFAHVGVATPDPRVWHGTLEREWRRRGWKLQLWGTPADVALGDLDILVVHHRLSITRVGHEADWISLVERARQEAPVLWVGPLGDPVWVSRLVEAGVSFLLPPPQGDSGEGWQRFLETISTLVDRHLAGGLGRGELPAAVVQLVDSLLSDAGPEEGLGVLLQVAASVFQRGAVFLIEETAVRCRAGFGYALNSDAVALPRGVGLLERIIRSREPVVGLDPTSVGAGQLARVLGVGELPQAAAVIPLCTGGAVVGCLVGDREGQPLGELDEMILLARRIGGALVE